MFFLFLISSVYACQLKIDFSPFRYSSAFRHISHRGNKQYTVDVACRNSMHYNVNSSHRNDSDIF
jgi:hypothetical protein